MATPLGHYLLGLSIARLSSPRGPRSWPFYLAFLGCAADLDFLFGILIGEPARFHRGFSHSLLASLMIGLIGVALLKRFSAKRWTLFFLLCSLYASHLLLDFFTLDTGYPYGIPLFWPSLETYQSPWVLLPNVQHSSRSSLSLHNLYVALRELLIFGTLCLLVFYSTSRHGVKIRRVFAFGSFWLLAVILLLFSDTV